MSNGFSNTMKSGPGPSTIALPRNATMIDPPLPSEITSSDPLQQPPPFGGPAAGPGSAWNVEAGFSPMQSETTSVTNRALSLRQAKAPSASMPASLPSRQMPPASTPPPPLPLVAAAPPPPDVEPATLS